MERSNRSGAQPDALPAVAANGLLDRRAFLRGGAALAAGMGGYALSGTVGAEALRDDPWSLAGGAVSPGYEKRSRFEEKIVRPLSNPNGQPRTSHARTPHHLINGTITPTRLPFPIVHPRS